MNEKKSILDLTDPIVESTGLSKKMVDTFLHNLMDVVEDSLRKDGIAKVKNFGTFKVIAIEERKSVNVQDGSEVVIPAHKKVTFTPDKLLKDEINKPYAHLETYVLKDDGPVDGPYIEDDAEEEEPEELMSQGTPGVVEAHLMEKPTDEKVQETSEEEMDRQPMSNVPVSEEPVENVKTVKVEEVESKSVNETTESIDTTTTEMGEMEIKENQESTESTDINSAMTSDMENKEVQESTESMDKKTTDMSEMEIKENQENTENVKARETEVSEIKGEKKKSEQSGKKTETKTSDNVEKKSSKWWLWLALAVLLIVLALFGVRYYLDYQKDVSETNTELAPVQSGEEEIEVGESDPFFAEDEPAQEDEFERAMAGDVVDPTIVEENTADVEQSEVVNESRAAEPVSNENVSGEMKSFDETLVKYMKEKHPEMNFPSTVAVKQEYTVLPGSRLMQISRNLYNGTADYWVYIYYYNRDVLKNPNSVNPGMVLKVPDLGDKFVDPKSSKCQELAKEIREALIK